MAVETIDQTVIATSSASGRKWLLKQYDERTSLALVQKFALPEITARILAARGITPDNAKNFLNPLLKNYLPDPSHLLDMDIAAERLSAAVIESENLVIFGDYDVDGATSSALLKRYFGMVGLETKIYIPDRIEEGYGPSIEAFQELKTGGADIIITVDCGTASFEPISHANNSGLEVIVIDHHLGADILPEAVAVVNPNRMDEITEHKNLAAVGICFLLAVAINRVLRKKGWFSHRPEPDLMQLLDLVAVGTICDVMSLTGLNRAFVTQGLKILAKRKNLGLSILGDVGKMNSLPNVYHSGFILGPRINAGGRIGKSDLGARLLSTFDQVEAQQIALELDKLNSERRTIETLILEEAIIQTKMNAEDGAVIFASGEGWHPGVIGIIASRLKEKYDKPAAVISLGGGIGKGSGRSVNGVNLGAAITSARMEGLLLKGGGHMMAAGFTVEEKRLNDFVNFINQSLRSQYEIYRQDKGVNIDAVINLTAINDELVKSIEKIGPFGNGNPEPKFVIKNVRVLKSDKIGENHLACIISEGVPSSSNAGKIRSVAFNCIGTTLGDMLTSSYGKDIHISGYIRTNNFTGKPEFLLNDAAYD